MTDVQIMFSCKGWHSLCTCIIMVSLCVGQRDLVINVDPEGMNCILGDGESARKYIRHQVGLIVLRRDGSRQDTAGLDRTDASVICILIILQTLSLFAYIRERLKGPCCCCNWFVS